MEATAGASKEIERKRAAERQREAEARAAAEQKARELKDKVVIVNAKCGDKGRLYGSVTSAEIAASLKEQYGLDLDKRKIDLKDPIRASGDVPVTLRLYPQVTTKVTVRVVGVNQ